MAQHVTTLNELREGMDPTDTPSNTDLIYAERGTGSDRARAFRVDEIAVKAAETLGDGGDIAFSSYQAAGGVTRTKGDIQDGKIVGRMFASVVNLIEKTLQWVNEGFGITELVWNGLRFYKNGSNAPDYLFDNDGMVKLSKLNFNTTIGSMICNFDSSHSYMVAQLITLRTRNSYSVNESVIESHCGVIGGGLPGMQWGYNRLTPSHDVGYIDTGATMISNMATGIPAAPPDTSTATVISYGPWTYHKHTYNGETTYFCMRYVFLGKWANTLVSSDKANSLMEPGLYCDASNGPMVVETVVAAAQWN